MARRIGLNDRIQKEKEIPTRTVGELIRSKSDIEKETREKYLSKKVATRKTFLLDPISIEALRIYTYEHRKGLSESIIDMMLKYIPREIWREARENVLEQDTPDHYFNDLEKLTIEDIYYHESK